MPGFAALPPLLNERLGGESVTIPQPPDDLDRPLRVYRVDSDEWLVQQPDVKREIKGK